MFFDGLTELLGELQHLFSQLETTRLSKTRQCKADYACKTDAAKQGIEGAVLLKFDIDSDGNTQNIEVITAKPAYIFDKVAKTALAQWRYESSVYGMKNQMVQLDFAMSENSAPIYLTEKIKVTKH